ncbi:FG-GAP-like repeat-containing protein [Novipirellula sp. SH528]|uniref:FG-GAP-like repeat-containing protein n=1 Tax=Novipirellula sp. SH528 TaxID=3454466 RepID=UPI003FA126A1
MTRTRISDPATAIHTATSGTRTQQQSYHGLENPFSGPSVPGSFNILFGDGSGNFGRGNKQESFFELAAVGAANLNGIDGDELIVLGQRQQLAVFRFDPNSGTMLRVTELSLNERSRKFAVGDLNRDGLLDIVVTGFGSDKVSFLLGDGSGAVSVFRDSDDASSPVDVDFGDFNGDLIDERIVAEVFQPTSSGLQALGLSTTLSLSSASRTVGPTVDVRQIVNFAPVDAIARLDVNRDNLITAADALQIINAISRIDGEGESVSMAVLADTDTNADGVTSALDALLVINFLARQSNGSMFNSTDLLSEDDDKVKAADEVFAHELF